IYRSESNGGGISLSPFMSHRLSCKYRKKILLMDLRQKLLLVFPQLHSFKHSIHLKLLIVSSFLLTELLSNILSSYQSYNFSLG
uniref:Ovule protein n=1 Tax=Parascaris univalens TaxID=6257 RepID=A0A915BNB5_PARUN